MHCLQAQGLTRYSLRMTAARQSVDANETRPSNSIDIFSVWLPVAGLVRYMMHMKFIAHRVFKDGETFGRLDAARLSGYHGVELDLRDDGRGGVCVNHAPLFRRSRVELSGRSLQDAVEVFGESLPSLEFLFLDVKTQAAAAILADLVARGGLPIPAMFNCWHAAEVRTIRDRVPDATIFFCIAPIFTRRLARRRFNDLYVSNSFPFFSRSARFTPDEDKENRHSINVKLICPESLDATLPDAIDGVCVHRIFHSPRLMTLLAARGLKSAVYGLPSRGHPRTQALDGEADFAIIRKERKVKPAPLHPSATHTRDKAA